MTSLNQANPPPALPLRILHTSDWHLGAKLYQVSRIEEHKRFLDWLLAQAQALKPHLIVVSGDIFDSPHPPADAEALYFQFLAAASQIPSLLKVIIAGGNHDSPSRLDAPKDILSPLRIHVVGGLTPRQDPTRCLCPISLHPGQPPIATVLVVPFIHEFHLGVRSTRQTEEGHRAELHRAFSKLYADLCDQALARWPNAPLIATGHLTCTGTQQADFKTNIHGWRNAEDNLPPDTFDPRIAYTALGHIHRPFPIHDDPQSPPIWYAGAPIPLRLDELGWQQQVLLVEISPTKHNHRHHVQVTPIPVPRTRDVTILQGPPDLISKSLSDMAHEQTIKPLSPLIFIDALVQSSQPTLNIQFHTLVAQIPEPRRPLLLHIRQTKIGHQKPEQTTPIIGLHLRDLSPEEVFTRLHDTRHHAPPPAPLLDAFRTLLNPQQPSPTPPLAPPQNTPKTRKTKKSTPPA